MAVSKEKKVEIANTLKERFQNAKWVAFTTNVWLTVSEISEMRNNLREANSTYMLAKKTLIKIVFKEVYGKDLSDEFLPGQIGVLFSNNDSIEWISWLAKSMKKLDAKKIAWTASFIDGEFKWEEDTIKISKLPSRDVLLAQFIGGLKSPLNGFVGWLSQSISKFSCALGSLKDELEKQWKETVWDLSK